MLGGEVIPTPWLAQPHSPEKRSTEGNNLVVTTREFVRL